MSKVGVRSTNFAKKGLDFGRDGGNTKLFCREKVVVRGVKEQRKRRKQRIGH